MSLDLFLSDQSSPYSNHVVVREADLEVLMASLKETNSSPRVYVLTANVEEGRENISERVSRIASYEDLLDKLRRRTVRGHEMLKK